MTMTAPLCFDLGSEQIEEMMGQGIPFGCVEDAIDGAELSRDHKAALWLLAWSLRDPGLQRQDARATVSLVRTMAGRAGFPE